LLRRRDRPSQAKVRSTIQRQGRSWKPAGISGGSWPGRTQTFETPVHQCLTTLTLGAKRRLHPLDEATAIARVHPQVPEPREPLLKIGQGLQQEATAVAVRDISGMDQRLEHKALGIDEQVPLAPGQFLASIVAVRVRRPPFSVVLTDWLSMIAALGVGSRPIRRRASSRSRVWSCSQVPSLRQRRK
jgi:hypothetical protein